MEYARRVDVVAPATGHPACLNPCFNGICAPRVPIRCQKSLRGLNPCFNGICAPSFNKSHAKEMAS